MDFPSQAAKLLDVYPDSLCVVREGELWWQGRLQPSAISRDYLVKLVVRSDSRLPLCYVLQPSPVFLVATSVQPGRALPHVYSLSGDPLCLFTGVGKEWIPTDSLADTIVPWASLWLRFFEVWLVTNTWEGSGAPYETRAARPTLTFEAPPREEHPAPLPDPLRSLRRLTRSS